MARQAARDKKLGRFLEQAKAKLQNEGREPTAPASRAQREA